MSVRTLVLVLLAGGAASAQQPVIGSVTASAAEVPLYGRLDLTPTVTGKWGNPFDPDQADLSADFTAPSGKVLTVPGFWHQEHAVNVVTPPEARRRVTFLKLFLEKKGAWSPHPAVDFYLDDVELRQAGSGKMVLLDDMEGAANKWTGSKWVALTDELAHGGKHSLKLHAETAGEEEWPGFVLPLDGADWSGYDGVSFWLYPRVDAPFGDVRLYFNDQVFGNSPVKAWQVGGDELKPNQWNHITWDFRTFPTQTSWKAQGEPGWRVRFCPTEVGEWTWRVRFRDREGAATSEAGRFLCTPSASPGFVRISRDDPHYFDFDNGTAFVPIGHDVSWGVGDARTLFPHMHAAGENCTYFILVPWDADFEWGKLGEYDLLAAAKLDSLLETAERNDIYVKLSFDVHDSLRAGAHWAENPYSAKRGGPCATPNDFYTNPEARRLYHRRLRYIAARYGWCTHLMAWEPVAEIDGGVERAGEAGWGYPGKPGAAAVTAMLTDFLRDTSAYLRQVCPYQRLFTNSFGGDVSDPAIQALPEVQYTQLHHYDSVDVGRTMSEWCHKLTSENAKPLMVTEFGWWADWTRPFLDREGVCQHNGIWASLLGGAAGSAQSWWWEHIEEWNLYPHYLALRHFVDGVDFPRQGFTPARATTQLKGTEPFSAAEKGSVPFICGPVSFHGTAPFAGGKVSEFTVRPDGSVTDADQVPSHLLAVGRNEPRVTPTFHLDCPQEGTFSVHVEAVCPDAELTLFVDGRPALKQDLPSQNVPGKLCTYSERYKLWSCRYDQDFAVPLTAGRHDVRLENTKPGISWIRVSSYDLSRYAPPALRVVGLEGKRLSLLWLQNTQHTWFNAVRGVKPAVIRGASVTLDGVADGAYQVEWWDTYAGRPTGTAEVTAAGGRLELAVPAVERDVACRVRRE